MGCGCGSTKSAAYKSRAVNRVAAPSVTPKVSSNAACIKKYDELAQLDRKAIALHKKFRRVGEVGYRYAEMQKVIRGWIVELRSKCPDDDELKEFSDYINSEYAKYFNA